MPTIDLGDPLPNLGVLVFNTAGALAPAASVVLSLTLPDGTSTIPTVTTAATGIYSAAYVTTQAGRHVGKWTATTITGGAAQEVYTDVWDVVAVTADAEPFVSLAEVKSHLRLTTTGNDEDLRRYALIATELAEEYLGRTLRRRTVVETLDGGSSALALRTTPVLSVTSVVESGTTLAAGTWTADLNAGVVYRGAPAVAGSYPWATGMQNVVVTYLAGPTDSTARYGQGVREIVRHLWDTQRGGTNLPRQAGAGDEWSSASGWSVPRRVMELLGTTAPGFA